MTTRCRSATYSNVNARRKKSVIVDDAFCLNLEVTELRSTLSVSLSFSLNRPWLTRALAFTPPWLFEIPHLC
jgi:hypothetical protein